MGYYCDKYIAVNIFLTALKLSSTASLFFLLKSKCDYTLGPALLKPLRAWSPRKAKFSFHAAAGTWESSLTHSRWRSTDTRSAVACEPVLSETHFVAYDDDQNPPVPHFFAVYERQA